ncbi:hypothetical protein M3P36_14330 [Altererythrobacter sp. KTW20L]|nr:hypothetical protein [Altererythrobacter sp. KTW20L]
MKKMIDHRFFASKLGLSALVSVAAMVAFNLFAIAQAEAHPRYQPTSYSGAPVIAVPMVELA